ncbi:TIGR03086 family metal-binding protein [Yinghuangia soli]|uniref:TIGR03086 family metal-binding protein n=1 Tax=Yinghuangia soli TaxID=2908204 RepID=A0AA41PUP2_9ACTN|nr:TIGR03086 family metal-binding protein [Yinghuangia soli]MCF2526195.1 TIGR03086 family metal-binding protein [Yinghuangia soli]
METVHVQDGVALLARATGQLGALIGRIGPEQRALPTPCALWDVRDLVAHAVEEVVRFALVTEARDGGDAVGVGAAMGDDWAAAYEAAASRLRSAWAAPGAVDRPQRLPFGEVPGAWAVAQQTTELAVHAWDLASALGEDVRELDEEVGQLALAWSRANIVPAMRGEAGGGFIGAEVEAAADAPTYEALAAFSGRKTPS